MQPISLATGGRRCVPRELGRSRAVLLAMFLGFTVSAPATALEVVSQRLARLPVSISAGGMSGAPLGRAISADGRFVLFGSYAGDLVAAPVNARDVFVRDLHTGTTTLVSVNAAGTAAGNGPSDPVAISQDGRYVLFESAASDLAGSDANGRLDVYVRDLLLGTTELVSVNAAGSGAGNHHSNLSSMSPDGRYVVFTSSATDLVVSDGNGRSDVFVRDLQAGVTTMASSSTSGAAGDESSTGVAISSDGRYVLFESDASNFAAGDAGIDLDVFRRDLQTGTTELVSVNRDGSDGGNAWSGARAMSPNGRFVLFWSQASNLVTTPDGNASADVFVRDLQAGVTTLVSITSAGTATAEAGATPAAISDNGRYVAFYSYANDLVGGDADSTDVFVRDLQTATTTLVSVDGNGAKGNANSYLFGGLMSADGRFVLFGSYASNLAAGDVNGAFDVFLRDRQLGTTTLVSAAAGGQPGDSISGGEALTEDGRLVVLTSNATDLVPGDLNGWDDVFVRDTLAATTVLASARGPLPPSLTGNRASWATAASGDGRHVLFTSNAEDLVSEDDNRAVDVFVRDLDTGTTILASRIAGVGDRVSTGVDLSLGGRYVLFDSTSPYPIFPQPGDEFVGEVYVHDAQTGSKQLVSVTPGGAAADGYSTGKAITPSGRYVLFGSVAPDLMAGDGNQTNDVFLRDMQSGVTELVSVDLAGSGSGDGWSSADAVTPNGRFVLFTSKATNLVSTTTAANDQVYVRDRQTGTTTLVSVNAEGTAAGWASSNGKAITPDGRYVLFISSANDLVPGDNNGHGDVFVRDLQAGTTTLVSVNRWGSGPANSWSAAYGISDDGRYVLFMSMASDVTPNDPNFGYDVFRRDLRTGTTVLVSVNAAGSGNLPGWSYAPSMSADGRLVAFESTVPNLAPGDGNSKPDAFLRDLDTGTTVLLSEGAGIDANGSLSAGPLIAASGTRVVFTSKSSKLVADDFNRSEDVFAAETGRTLPTLPFADGFEPGDLTAWASYEP